MKIYLIRHGKTIANEKRLYCGKTDLPLSEAGISELESLKELYKDIDKTNLVFYTSGKKRANESLEILFDKPNYLIDHRLEEMNFGDFEMKSYNDLKEDIAYKEWISDVNNNRTPNGESSKDQEQRVIEAFKDILNNNNKDVVIMTHGGSIYYIYQYLMHSNMNIYEIMPDNGRGYIFTKHDKWDVSKL